MNALEKFQKPLSKKGVWFGLLLNIVIVFALSYFFTESIELAGGSSTLIAVLWSQEFRKTYGATGLNENLMDKMVHTSNTQNLRHKIIFWTIITILILITGWIWQANDLSTALGFVK